MLTKLAVCTVVIILSCSVANGITIAFDDVPSGTVLGPYAYTYGYGHVVGFSDDFRATDHTGSPWGPPHSPSNVLTSEGGTNSWIAFGHGGPPIYPDPVQSVGAYFSTDAGAMVRITAYQTIASMISITSIVIGAPGESWNNRYVEISTTPALPFDTFRIEGVQLIQ